ncbi:MAG: serine/threonine-protein kinase [Myxococcota bacterium]
MQAIQASISGYRIARPIASDGAGTLYTARDENAGRVVCIRLLKPELCSDRERVERYFARAKAAGELGHPGIARVQHSGFQDNGAAYLVMEVLDGESLSARFARGDAFPVKKAIRLAGQLAHVLAGAHSRGVVHSALSPSSVFVLNDASVPGGERIKLFDFGLAELAANPRDPMQVGAVIGSFKYLSPEQCRGVIEGNHRADLYSVGCLLFAMLCGRPPFNDDSPAVVMASHISDTPLAPTSFRRDLPRDIDAISNYLLAKDPDLRYPSAVELGSSLVAILREPIVFGQPGVGSGQVGQPGVGSGQVGRPGVGSGQVGRPGVISGQVGQPGVISGQVGRPVVISGQVEVSSSDTTLVSEVRRERSDLPMRRGQSDLSMRRGQSDLSLQITAPMPAREQLKPIAMSNRVTATRGEVQVRKVSSGVVKRERARARLVGLFVVGFCVAAALGVALIMHLGQLEDGDAIAGRAASDHAGDNSALHAEAEPVPAEPPEPVKPIFTVRQLDEDEAGAVDGEQPGGHAKPIENADNDGSGGSSADRITWRILSSPSGAAVLDGEDELGTTPLAVELDATPAYTAAFTVRREGHEDAQIELSGGESAERSVELNPLVAIAVESRPPEAKIVDAAGNALGVTPTEVFLPRSEDTAVLTLKLEGYEDYALEVTPERKRRVRVKLDKKRAEITIVIDSEPQGAVVTKNGTELGTTPVEDRFPERNGSIKYRLKLDGYRSKTVRLRGDRDGSKLIKLSKCAKKSRRTDALSGDGPSLFDPYDDPCR